MTWPQYLRRECSVCGFTISLSPMQAEILLVLMLRCPNHVTVAELIEMVWHGPLWTDLDAEPMTAVNTIEVTLHTLRRKIGSFHIGGRRGYGYRLVQEPGW